MSLIKDELILKACSLVISVEELTASTNLGIQVAIKESSSFNINSRNVQCVFMQWVSQYISTCMGLS